MCLTPAPEKLPQNCRCGKLPITIPWPARYGRDQILQSRAGSFQPFRRHDAAALDDRPHSSERQHAATVMGNDDLLSSEWMPPLLVTSGSANPQKGVMAKNYDHLI